MDRIEFLNELAVGLAGLARADRRQVLDYYNEMILDGIESGKPEDQVVEELGTPEQVAAQVLAGYGARQASAQVQARQEEQAAFRAGQVAAQVLAGLDAAQTTAREVVAGFDAGQAAAHQQAGYEPRPGHEPEKPLEYTFEGTGLRIEIRARDTRVELRRAKGGRPRVLAYGCREDWLIPEVTSEAFRLTLRVPMFFSNLWFLLQTGERRRLVLELPEGFADGVSVKTTNADIAGDGLRLGGKARLSSTNNRISLEDSRFEILSACSSNGSMTLTDLSGQKCKAETSNGRIRAENCHFAKKLLLATSNGPVRVENISAPVISLTTSNAPIKGWVRGREEDYAVTSGTSNASSVLRDTSACIDRPGRLLAETSNAPIKLGFAESEEDEEEAAWNARKKPGTQKGPAEAGAPEGLGGVVKDALNGLQEELEGLQGELEGLQDELEGLQDELEAEEDEEDDWDEDEEEDEDEED